MWHDVTYNNNTVSRIQVDDLSFIKTIATEGSDGSTCNIKTDPFHQSAMSAVITSEYINSCKLSNSLEYWRIYQIEIPK